MSILAAFMVPHPPMIVPEIGQGSEAQVAETTRAYEQAEKELESFETLDIRQAAKIVLTKLQVQASSKYKKEKSNGSEKQQKRQEKAAKMSEDLKAIMSSSKNAFELLQAPAV